MRLITVNRLISLDENIKHPSCHVCNKECSAFEIADEELDNFGTEKQNFLYEMTKKEYLYKNMLGNGKHLIFVCTKCVPNQARKR